MVDRFNALVDRNSMVFDFEAWFNDYTAFDRSWEVNENTWNSILSKRIEKIKEITMLSEQYKFKIGIDVGYSLLEYIRELRVENFVNVFIDYRKARERWSNFIGGIDNLGNGSNYLRRR